MIHQNTPRVRIWPSADTGRYLDIASSDVQRFTATADIGSPAGQFSITLAPRRGSKVSGGRANMPSLLARQIPHQSVVSLGHDQDGGIMLGLVTGVSEATSLEGGTVGDSITLTGQSLGAGLAQDTIVNARMIGDNAASFRRDAAAVLGEDSPILAFFPESLGPVRADDPDKTPVFAGSSVREVVDWILTRAPSMRIPLLAAVTGRSGSIGEYLRTDKSVTTWNDARVWTNALQTYQGNVWGFLQGAVDADFYEMFIDTQPEAGKLLPRADLILRPKPFDDDDLTVLPVEQETGLRWRDLRTRWNGREHHVLDELVLRDRLLSWDDAEAFAYYTVTSRTDVVASTEVMRQGLAFPVLDLYHAQRWGLRTYAANLNLLGGDMMKRHAQDAEYDNQIQSDLIDFRNRLVNWYRWAPWFLKGSVTVHGKDEHRPGEPYYLPWAMPPLGGTPGVRAYGHSVSWAWTFGGTYTTSIGFVRGYNPASIDAARRLVRDAWQARLKRDGQILPNNMLAVG